MYKRQLTARQAYELGLQVPTVASPAITMDQVRDLCEPDWVEGWYSVTDFVGNSDDPEVTAFCDKYASDYGEGPKLSLIHLSALHTYRLNSFAILKNCSNVVEPHRRILEALAQHDAEAADLEMRQHMRISKNDTREAARNAGMDAQF